MFSAMTGVCRSEQQCLLSVRLWRFPERPPVAVRRRQKFHTKTDSNGMEPNFSCKNTSCDPHNDSPEALLAVHWAQWVSFKMLQIRMQEDEDISELLELAGPANLPSHSPTRLAAGRTRLGNTGYSSARSWRACCSVDTPKSQTQISYLAGEHGLQQCPQLAGLLQHRHPKSQTQIAYLAREHGLQQLPQLAGPAGVAHVRRRLQVVQPRDGARWRRDIHAPVHLQGALKAVRVLGFGKHYYN